MILGRGGGLECPAQAAGIRGGRVYFRFMIKSLFKQNNKTGNESIVKRTIYTCKNWFKFISDNFFSL